MAQTKYEIAMTTDQIEKLDHNIEELQTQREEMAQKVSGLMENMQDLEALEEEEKTMKQQEAAAHNVTPPPARPAAAPPFTATHGMAAGPSTTAWPTPQIPVQSPF
eukprot:8678120-Pyramimonas_sp.AAC.1